MSLRTSLPFAIGGALALAAVSLTAPSPAGAGSVSRQDLDPSPVRDTLSRTVHTDPALAREAALKRGGEVYPFRWRLGGFLGAIAGLFVPNHGDAQVTFVSEADSELMEIEVLITAPKREGEYFLYGAALAKEDADTQQVWEAQSFRGKTKEKEQDVEKDGQIDFASAIYYLREHPPKVRTRMTIWNNGKTYPVDVQPLGLSTRKIAGEKIEVLGYSVIGVESEDGNTFKDDLYLYYLPDDRSTPAQIVGKRGPIILRLTLDSIPEG